MGLLDKIFKKSKDKQDAPKDAAAPKEQKKAAPAAAPAAGGYIANSPIEGFVPGLGAPAGGKIKLAIYWAAACGGCDVSILDSDEKILNVGAMADIVMWPVAADGKEKDIEAMEDGEILVSIISGAVRNTENEHMVKLLRKKSKVVVSYGTCACFGGTPALANLVNNSKEIPCSTSSTSPRPARPSPS